MITKEEYGLLKYYHTTGYKWIARDENKELCVYKIKPIKLTSSWLNFNIRERFDTVYDDDHLFQYIKWDDEEPTKILDLIQDYESHQIITSEDEPLYYALIKGHELSSNEFKYWSCNAYSSGDLFIGSKHPKARCINRMTKNNWDKFGINSSNADFVLE